MNKDELLSLVADEEAKALGQQYGELSTEREKALDYYFGRKFGNEVEGRSQVISTDVRDSIEGILPMLLDIFTSSKNAVEFDPQGMEDEAQAKQATELANYIFYRQNNGFLILYQWFKDALLQKNGIVKFWYEKKETVRKEKYKGLNELELMQLLQTPNLEVSSTMERDDGSLEIEVTIRDAGGKICIANVPPEEFLVSPHHNSISVQSAPFVAHRCKKTITELKEMGYETKDLRGDDNSVEFSPEYLARRQFDEETLESDSSDDSMRRVWVSEVYMRVDYDGDGVAELRKILKCGDTILENEEAEIIPFAAITPIIMCHRFFGLSLADQTMDIQYHKSVLWRQMMDNLYLTNNPRIGVLENQVELDDLLNGRVGGIVRHKVPNAITPIETRFVAGQSFPMLEYLDSVKENRSGVTRYNQGSDADSLNKTATGVSRIMDAAMLRTKLIARVFAETGVVDLFKGILHCLSKYSTEPMQVRLSNKFEVIDPRQWKTMWDMTVNVGLGTGDKTQQLMQLQSIATQQFTLRQAGAPWVTDQNLYNMAKKQAELAGYPHDGYFFTDPATIPPPEPGPDPNAAAMQAEAQKAQMTMQVEGAKIQQKGQETQATVEIEKYKADLQAQTQMALEQMRQQTARELEMLRIDSQAQMKIFEANNAQQQADGIKQEMGSGLQALGQQLVQVSENLLKMEEMQTVQTQTIEQIIGVITGDREIVTDEMGEPTGIRIIPSSMRQLPQGPIMQNVNRGMA
jgi:hypothetical protein